MLGTQKGQARQWGESQAPGRFGWRRLSVVQAAGKVGNQGSGTGWEHNGRPLGPAELSWLYCVPCLGRCLPSPSPAAAPWGLLVTPACVQGELGEVWGIVMTTWGLHLPRRDPDPGRWPEPRTEEETPPPLPPRQELSHRAREEPASPVGPLAPLSRDGGHLGQGLTFQPPAASSWTVSGSSGRGSGPAPAPSTVPGPLPVPPPSPR